MTAAAHLRRIAAIYFLAACLAAGFTLGAFVQPDRWSVTDLKQVDKSSTPARPPARPLAGVVPAHQTGATP